MGDGTEFDFDLHHELTRLTASAAQQIIQVPPGLAVHVDGDELKILAINAALVTFVAGQATPIVRHVVDESGHVRFADKLEGFIAVGSHEETRRLRQVWSQ